jgi:hypothetical protein
MVVSLGAAVTVDSLVSLVKQKTVVPTTASLFSAANVAALLDDAMRTEGHPAGEVA